jgi:hypothetical protein
MPEQKRPRGSSRGSTSRSSSGSRSTGRARGTSGGRSGSSSGRKLPPRAPSSARNEELEPLDLEGTDFEELLEASATSRARRGQPEAEPAFEAEGDDVDDGASTGRMTPIRASGSDQPVRSGMAPTAASFGAATDPDTARTLSERFGSDPATDDIAPWAALDADAPLPDESGTPTDMLLVAAAGLALAAATWFLPWYQRGSGTLTAIAGAKYGLGAITFVGGLGSFIVAMLRRSKVAIRFPLQSGVIIEILAYAAVAGAILGRFIRPENVTVKNANTLIAVGLGIAIALLASRLTSGAPLMTQPDWLRQPGGRNGALVLGALVVAIAGLAIAKPGGPKAPVITGAPTFSATPTACFKDVEFPNLRLVTPSEPGGYYDAPSTGGQTFCVATLTSEVPLGRLEDTYLTALKKAGFDARVVKEAQPNKGSTEITFSEPICGTVRLLNTSKTPGIDGKTSVTAQLGGCPPAPEN